MVNDVCRAFYSPERRGGQPVLLYENHVVAKRSFLISGSACMINSCATCDKQLDYSLLTTIRRVSHRKRKSACRGLDRT